MSKVSLADAKYKIAYRMIRAIKLRRKNMAYRRYRRRRKQSSPSMASTLTKPFRALPNAMGLKSPILHELVDFFRNEYRKNRFFFHV